MEKYNEIQLTKNKMDLNNGIMKNPPPSSEYITCLHYIHAYTKCPDISYVTLRLYVLLIGIF